jgi:hypothetical protein
VKAATPGKRGKAQANAGAERLTGNRFPVTLTCKVFVNIQRMSGSGPFLSNNQRKET